MVPVNIHKVHSLALTELKSGQGSWNYSRLTNSAFHSNYKKKRNKSVRKCHHIQLKNSASTSPIWLILAEYEEGLNINKINLAYI